MAGSKAVLWACAVVLTTTYAAFAVDLPPAPSLDPPPAEAAEFSGWYLRGDVGIGLEAGGLGLAISPNALNAGNPGDLPYSSAAKQSFANTSLSRTGEFDLGVGYQLNRWLRGDLTLEYRGGGTLQSNYQIRDPVAPATPFSSSFGGRVSSVIGLVNLYGDIGTWFGFTPFVGGGIGMTNNRLNGVTCQPGGSSRSGAASFANGSTNAFAWALMTGVDFNVAPNIELEFSYRYLDAGGLRTGVSNCPAGASTIAGATCQAGATYSVASSNALTSSDFRIGVIWTIGEAALPFTK